MEGVVTLFLRWLHGTAAQALELHLFCLVAASIQTDASKPCELLNIDYHPDTSLKSEKW